MIEVGGKEKFKAQCCSLMAIRLPMMAPAARDVAKLWSAQKLWPAYLLLVALFFLLGFLYNSCYTCNSDIAWLSRRSPSDPSFSLIASDFPLSPKLAPLLEVRQLDYSVDRSEKTTPIIISTQGNHSTIGTAYTPSESGSEGFLVTKKGENFELEGEKADQFFDHTVQNGTNAKALADFAHEEEKANPSNWQGSQRTPINQRAELKDENNRIKPRTLEQELLAARKKIFFDPTVETDALLYAHVYSNLTSFIKSYGLMEKMFKIFIYKDGSNPLFHTGPITGIYASEGRFIRQLLSSKRFITIDPSKAHLFFMPFSVTNMVRNLYVPDSHDMHPITDFITNYATTISSKYPYWNLTHGADHFFISCHDWGPAVARGHAELRHNAIKAVCNADLTEEFVIGKDVSLPETTLRAAKPPTHLGGLPARKRPYLAFFAGQMHGRVRPLLLQHWQNKFPEMKIYGRIPSAIARKISYVRHMRMSKYCICPMGYEVNSPRIVEAIHYDCVPVIIADEFVLPFSEVLDWPAFSVSVNESDISRLRDILLSIPEPKYRMMQGSLKHLRQHFSWSFRTPVKYDIFHMILHSLWVRRLASLPE